MQAHLAGIMDKHDSCFALVDRDLAALNLVGEDRSSGRIVTKLDDCGRVLQDLDQSWFVIHPSTPLKEDAPWLFLASIMLCPAMSPDTPREYLADLSQTPRTDDVHDPLQLLRKADI